MKVVWGREPRVHWIKSVGTQKEEELICVTTLSNLRGAPVGVRERELRVQGSTDGGTPKEEKQWRHCHWWNHNINTEG